MLINVLWKLFLDSGLKRTGGVFFRLALALFNDESLLLQGLCTYPTFLHKKVKIKRKERNGILFHGLQNQRPQWSVKVSLPFLARFGSNFVCRKFIGHCWQIVSRPLKPKAKLRPWQPLKVSQPFIFCSYLACG